MLHVPYHLLCCLAPTPPACLSLCLNVLAWQTLLAPCYVGNMVLPHLQRLNMEACRLHLHGGGRERLVLSKVGVRCFPF